MEPPLDIARYHTGLTSIRTLLAQMETLYQTLEAKLADLAPPDDCSACGRCCDFEAFGHRLYLTTPEWLFFAHRLGTPPKPMTDGVCPYRIDGKCSVYPLRFAGCRIFQCKGRHADQSDLTEATLAQLKQLCQQHNVPYYYMDLKTALKNETA